MAMFVINHHGHEGMRLAAGLSQMLPADHFQIAPGLWLAAFDGTSKQLCERLHIQPGGIGATLVVSISGYYGMESTETWEWLRTKWEGGPHGP